jgi:ribose 5-phosphate isomerase B
LKIAIGNDHAGLVLKKEIIKLLNERNIEIIDCGPNENIHVYSPIIAEKVCHLINNNECDRGILICGTGVGMSIAANKINGIRCAVSSEPYTAKMSRSHNNTNVLALGGRVLGTELAKMIVTIWIDEQFEGGKRNHSYNLIAEIEEKNKNNITRND